jgi:hypothetical protein
MITSLQDIHFMCVTECTIMIWVGTGLKLVLHSTESGGRADEGI